MELNQLRYVAAVADTGNFTRAAARCNVSQPSLSQQIINLEHEVGHKLFHRLGRKAVLTEGGRVFLERARHILFEVENATKELSDHPSLGRRITVGSIPTLAPYLIPLLIERSRTRYKYLQVDVCEDFKTNLITSLVEGSLDLAIMALPVKHIRLHVEPLFREPLLLVVAQGAPVGRAAAGGRVRPGRRDLRHAGLGEHAGGAGAEFLRRQPFRAAHRFRCAQIATVKALVALGVGISILPRVAQAPEDQSSLAYITLADGAPHREIGIVRHLQRYQSRGAEQFLTLVRERAAEVGGSA